VLLSLSLLIAPLLLLLPQAAMTFCASSSEQAIWPPLAPLSA
jgi:hypothetical protein